MSKYSRTGAGFGSQTASRTGVARSWGTESGEWPDQVWALGSIRFSHQASAFCSTYEIPPPLLLCWQWRVSEGGVSVPYRPWAA